MKCESCDKEAMFLVINDLERTPMCEACKEIAEEKIPRPIVLPISVGLESPIGRMVTDQKVKELKRSRRRWPSEVD